MESLTSPTPSDAESAESSLKRLPKGLFTNVALAVAVAFFTVGAVVPFLTGGTVMTVMTGSMAPSLPPGHIIVYHPVDADNLKTGDVIAYQPADNITGGVPASTDAAKKKAESDAFWAKVNKENQEIAAANKAQTEAFNASTEPAQAAPVETQTDDRGWAQFAGDYYFRYADKSEYDCSYARCIMVRVKTMAAAGCPDGLYVEATVDAGGASVGRANAITASLPQGKEAIVKLTDTSGMGEKIALTELHCLGE